MGKTVPTGLRSGFARPSLRFDRPTALKTHFARRRFPAFVQFLQIFPITSSKILLSNSNISFNNHVLTKLKNLEETVTRRKLIPINIGFSFCNGELNLKKKNKYNEFQIIITRMDSNYIRFDLSTRSIDGIGF